MRHVMRRPGRTWPMRVKDGFYPRRSAWERRRRLLAARRKNGEERIALALEKPVVPCDNPSGIIVFDTETTGLDPDQDEILQISIIDGYGETLLNSYVSPYFNNNWPKAQRVNGISREMVRNAPYPHELIPVVRGLFETAKTLMAYNNPFDLSFLSKWGVFPEGKRQIDVMRQFARIYGEKDDKHGGFKWKKLLFASEYFGYTFKAHDSLEDAKATLYIYNQMQGC